MKNLLFLYIFCTACTTTETKQEPSYIPVNIPKEKAPDSIGYYCPMKCEGEKVYPSDRYPCPVCKMKLIKTK